MAELVERWATMPLPELMADIQATTGFLAGAIQDLASHEGAYQRKYWSHWQTCPAEMSVAAAQRDCELVCKEIDEQRIIGRALVESYTVKRDSMLAILRARTP